MSTSVASNGGASASACKKKGILKHRSSTDIIDVPRNMNENKHLKDSSSDLSNRRRMQWDEMNILATFHPADKDYGFIKIDEPSTPYHRHSKSYSDDDNEASWDGEANNAKNYFSDNKHNRRTSESSAMSNEDGINFDDLRNKLDSCTAATDIPKYMQTNSSFDNVSQDEDMIRNKEFENHRKAHYNEFQMAQLLRKQIHDEDEDEDDDENNRFKNQDHEME